MGILSDTYDEIKTLPPAGKVIAVGAVAGVGLIALHAFRSGQSSGGSGGSGPATGANLTTSQGTDPWGDKWWIPSAAPGQPTTTSPTPTPTTTTPPPTPSDPLNGQGGWFTLPSAMSPQSLASAFHVRSGLAGAGSWTWIAYDPLNAGILPASHAAQGSNLIPAGTPIHIDRNYQQQ